MDETLAIGVRQMDFGRMLALAPSTWPRRWAKRGCSEQRMARAVKVSSGRAGSRIASNGSSWSGGRAPRISEMVEEFINVDMALSRQAAGSIGGSGAARGGCLRWPSGCRRSGRR